MTAVPGKPAHIECRYRKLTCCHRVNVNPKEAPERLTSDFASIMFGKHNV